MSTYWSTEAPMWIIKDSYRPARGKSRMIETPILSSTSSGWPYASIVQHTGRERKHITFTAHVSDFAYYEQLHDDWVSATPQQFMGPDATTGYSFVIFELGEPQWLLSDDIRFTLDIVETST